MSALDKDPQPSSKASPQHTRSSSPSSTNTPLNTAATTPPSSASTGISLRVIVLLIATALFLLFQSSILQPLKDVLSSTSSSHHHHHRNPNTAPAQFGTPVSKDSSSSFSSSSHPNAYQKQTAQDQRNQRHQKRQHSPFEDFFGTQEHEDEHEGDHSDHSDTSVSEACAGYYCKDTDVCVDRPIQCPCPYDSDTKCITGDWYVCFRGKHRC